MNIILLMVARIGDVFMSIIYTPNLGFHFIWKRDIESVARYGVLSRYLFFKLGKKHPGGHIFKAQKQAGVDLISIWDPWAFLKRHWRNRPLGSDNKPWEIIESCIEKHFQDPEEIQIVKTLGDPDPSKWFGMQVYKNIEFRRKFNLVRRRVASIVSCFGQAPGLTEAEIHCWIDHQLEEISQNNKNSEPEVCLLLDPEIRRYDYPGYKQFENFIRFRIKPKSILGIVIDNISIQEVQFMNAVASAGFRIYYTDGTEITYKKAI